MNTVPDLHPVVLGKISGHHGVKGWVKLFSYTRPRSEIFEYDNWLIGQANPGVSWTNVGVSEFRENAKGLVAKLRGFDSREDTSSLIGSEFGVNKSNLEELQGNEYYWMDLIGLRVINKQELDLGKVKNLMETGANDVLVVRTNAMDDEIERLIPWTSNVVSQVDLENGTLTVDWEEGYSI